MQEGKIYLLKNIKALLSLDETPYELSDGSILDKFLNSDQEALLLSCLPTKQFRVIQPTSKFPTEGQVVAISKLRSGSSLSSFYNISVKPASQFKYLQSYLSNVYEPILTRVKDSSLFAIKQLKAVLANSIKTRLFDETDTNFNTIEEEYDFWQEQDIENPSPRCSYFLKEYTPIAKSWRNVEALDFGKLGSLIETTWSVLATIWNSDNNYLDKRFTRLVEIFQTEVKNKIKLAFSRESDLFEMSFDIKQKIIQSVFCCKRFINLSQFYQKNSKRKMPVIKTKTLEELLLKILATQRIKSKVEMLTKLYKDKMIPEDPSSLIFLVKAENFMTNYMAIFKNNPKAQQKLEKEKQKLAQFSRMVKPLVHTAISEALKKQGIHNLYKALEKWYFFLSDSEIIEDSHELQDRALQKVMLYLQSKQEQSIKKEQRQSSVAEKLKIRKMFKQTVKQWESMLGEFTVNSETHPKYKQKNSTWAEQAQKSEKKYLKSFKDYYEGLLNDKANGGRVLGKVVEKMILTQQEGMVILFCPENEIFIHEMKRILQMNFSLEMSEKLLKGFEQAKRYYKENCFIKNLQGRFNSIEGRLQFFQRNMLKKELGDLQQLIQNPPIKKKLAEGSYEWKDEKQVEAFIQAFNKSFQKLAYFLKIFNDSETQIEEIALDILSIDFNPLNFFVISQKLQNVNRLIENVSINRETAQWREFWKHKLTEVVGLIWKQSVIKGINIPLTLNLAYVGGACVYQPDLSEAKQKYMKELKSYIGWPCQSRHLNGSVILQSESETVLALYKAVEQTFKLIEAKKQNYLGIERVLDIDMDSLEEKINKDEVSSEKLSQILVGIKEVKNEIDVIPEEERVGSIIINNEQVKRNLNSTADEKIESIIQLIKYSVKMESEQVEEYITNAMKKIEGKPSTMNEMADAMKEFDDIRAKEQQIEKKIKEIQTRNNNVRSITGASFNTANMMKRWENFQIASVEMGRILGEQKNRLQEDSFKKSEAIQGEVNKLYQRYQQIKPKSENLDREQVLEVYGRIKQWYGQWTEIEQRVQTIKTNITNFSMKMPEFSVFQKVRSRLKNELGNWLMFMEFRTELEKFETQEWITFRGTLFKYGDVINAFMQKSKQITTNDTASKFFKEMLNQNKQMLSLLRCVTGENFQKQHWGMLFSILKIKHVSTADKLLFVDLLDSNLIAKSNEIRELEARAKGQITIKDALGQLEAWGFSRQFELTQYNSMGRMTTLIKQWKDVMTEVSDHQAMVSSIRESKWAGRFKDEIEKYENKFGILDDALLKLNQIQRKWIYLEPIFMRGALPNEQGRWRRLDEEYRNIMKNVSNNPTVLALSDVAGFQQTLSNIITQLEKCQKALNDFIQEKRNKFPRFYFLGDDDMLEILGQSQNPTIIQMHLKKLFSGIHRVSFGNNNETLLAMKSSLNEEVKLANTIEVTQIVENWLEELNRNMVTTLQNQLARINHESATKFRDHSAQIICLTNEIIFNREAANAIERNSTKELKSKYLESLSQLTKKCHQESDQLILSKIKSLILDLIHQISILDLLISKAVRALSNWNWHKQLKFGQRGQGVGISMAGANFEYSFEYQGNPQKLVYTPLTDKCYLTLTQAMKMGLGGNPYGPAGTGKTESVKALALAFGRQSLVFNCDQGLDFHSMGRIFIGLVKCGAWGCFDEFNRLLEEQLSAISQQIQVIQQAIKSQEKQIHLLGKQIDVNFNSGIFVTLNPAGKGYGGRSKLPDNLKQLFRPIAMSVPDNELIAQTLLFSEGFTTAKVLAAKIITIFTLSKQLLSKQLHYDWGLRALKTILTVAGRLIFQEKQHLNEKKEAEILIKALRINTMSKLTFNDMLKFNVLVQDVFPGTQIKDIIYEQISRAVEEVFREDKYEMQANQLNKILQFYEATKQRIGAVLVGPSGCGKTTIWKTLRKAYEKLNQAVKVYLINPKSMPRSAFLGYMNNDTRQFSEGVLTVSAREVIKQESSTLSWIICDGDVDPQWIEALNSVLDDNHLLTLPTGERISFGSNVNFIFQTDNLQFASPATISRMGMIFLNEEDININGIISKWAKNLPAHQQFIRGEVKNIQNLCEKVYDSNFVPSVSTTKVGLVRNALSLLHNSADEQEYKLNLVKGLCTNFEEANRCRIFQIVYGKPVPGNRDPLGLTIKNGKITEYKDRDTEEVQRIYMTKAMIKDMEIVQSWLRSNQNVIIVGKQGCGKSLLLEASLQEMQKHEKCKLVTIHCNRETKSEQVIHKLFQSCQKVTAATGKILKPLNCSRQIFLLKEVNLPKPDKYNTIELITFLQSLMTHEGFYDHNLEFVKIGEGIHFVCIMKPATTIGRFQLSTRFVSNLRVLKIDYDSVGIRQKLKLLTSHAEAVAQKLSQFWQIVNENFKYDDNAHYLFSPRNLNGIVDHLESYLIDYQDSNQLFGALHYELNKQFGDRLVDAQSKTKFNQLIMPVFGDHSNLGFFIQANRLKPCARVHYIEILQGCIKSYENEVKEANIILVKETVDLFASIQKKMIDRGHMLLAGSSGSLRKTSVRVLAFKHKITLCTLSNTRNPTLKEFYKDLRIVIEQAAGQNKQVILFLEEHQLGRNIFYQKINSLISSGEVTGLFSPDELEGIIQDPEQLRSEFYGKTLYECFVQRTKKNLTIILSFDHRNKQFYEVCSSNPAFYSHCRIVWSNCYSAPSLKQICISKTKELNLKEMSELAEGFISIHEGSSLKYIELISNFVSTYQKLQSKSGSRLDKLNLGLKKLKETAKIVDELTADAVKKQKLLTRKQKEASESLDQITEAMQQATASKAQKQTLEKFLASQQKKIEKDKKEVMIQLERVQPLIQQAKTAVSGLSKKNIEDIRAFINPPETVRHVLKAVLTIFGNKDDTWNSMKNFLKVCKENILYFEIKDIKQSIRRDVQSIIETNAYSFQRQNVIKASQSAVPLRDWVMAVIQFSKTYEKVRPLEENLNRIEKQLSVSRKRKNECAEKIAEADAKQVKLNDEFIKKKNEAQMLKAELIRVKNAMQSGKELLQKLEGEKTRWQSESDKLKVDVQMLPRSTALTAAFLTYLSATPENVRHKKIQEWKKVFKCHYFNFLNFVTTQASTLQQVSEGLPNDQLSIENSQIISLKKNKIPLIIDPHTQATSWLKSKLAKSGTVEGLTQQDSKFLNTFELAVRFGKTLVIQEIDFIEPIFTPILKLDYVKQGPRNLMQIGEKIVDVNETFKFILTTRNSSIDIPHHQADLVSIINFSVTRSGLQGKLLSLIISHFQPEIEREKQKLLETQQKLKINLSDLEQKLLKELADSAGNILENKQLIKSLNNTKEQGEVVVHSLKQSQTLQKQIDQKRQIFLPISEIGAKLYISLGVLKKLNPMYRYNLSQFISMFEQSLKVGQDSGRQIQQIERSLIKIVYDNISIGLLKSHRLLLGLVIIKQALDEMMPDQEFQALIGNGTAKIQKNVPSWVDEKQKERFSNFLLILPNKPNFSSEKWSEWYKNPSCEEMIPKQANLTTFQETILVASCRLDRLISSFAHFVLKTLNLDNLSGIEMSMQNLSSKKMTNKIPCLFIVSVGFDPSKEIQEHAAKTVGKQKFHQLSMGGDQNQYALELLRQAAQKGTWLCLKNLHLVLSFVTVLEKQLLTMEPHQDFRLFLTTEAREKFPPILLEQCYKVSYEAPPGLKKNFGRILGSQAIGKDQPLSMILTYFHALIQERKNYIPQGWTKPYEFNYGDYKSGLSLISQLANNFDIDWEMLHGLLSDTIYGGRIDNTVDLRILNTYLAEYFNQDMVTGKRSLAENLTVKNIDQFKTILNDEDSPQLYGLPHGIDKAINRIQGREALENLKILSTATVESTKFSRQAWQKTLASLFNLWRGLQKLVAESGIKDITEKQLKSIDPIDNFVYNQAFEAKKNYQYIKHGLSSLEKVLFGNDILVSEVEQLGKVLLRGEVYSKWTKIWEGPELVVEWLKIFIKKLISLQKWVEMAQSQKLLSAQLDLSEVYRPQIFFNALKQKVGRQKKIPVDSLTIKCTFTSPSGEIAAKLKNLILEGCSRSGGGLCDSKDNSEYEQIPVLYVYYTRYEKIEDAYLIPFYTENTRSNLLALLPIKVEGSYSKKIIAGAAFMIKA